MLLIMNPNYYDALEARYVEKKLTPQDLPAPCSGVPLTGKDYDYKTFWVEKFKENQNEQ